MTDQSDLILAKHTPQAMTAEGVVGAMFDPGVYPWDYAATQVLVREAGGRFQMSALNDSGSFSVLFGKPVVVQWVLDQIA